MKDENKAISLLSYTRLREEDFKRAKELYVKTKQVEYSKQDHYVTVGGVVINGINKADMQKIIKEVGGK